MFEIKIFGYEEAKALAQSGWPTKIISLIKEDMPNWETDKVKHLRLQFDDVHTPTQGYTHPTEFHLGRIFDFAKTFVEEDKVLVHCIAGISRSTAAAIGICMFHGMSYEDAYNHIATVRPILAPNKLLIEYIDDHFKLQGLLYMYVEEKVKFPNLTGWKTKGGIILPHDPRD